MRVLLDSNLPRTLAALLPAHRVESVHQRRWSDLDDGPLLDAAEAEYDAFITADQRLRYQQNLGAGGSVSSSFARRARVCQFWRLSPRRF